MPIDFDPVFHTETMVKILREQGSTQYAMELAELILQKNPQHEGVRRILEELREEARRAFERFKSGGRVPEVSENSGAEGEESAVAAEAAERGTENTADENPLDLKEPSSPSPDLHAVGVVASTEACESLDAGPELRAEGLSRPLREDGLEIPPEAAAQTDGLAALSATTSEPIRLTLVPSPPPPTRRETKILRLQALLRRVQSLRKAAHAPQA